MNTYKKILYTTILVLSLNSCDNRAKNNARQIDSLHQADSIRQADSIAALQAEKRTAIATKIAATTSSNQVATASSNQNGLSNLLATMASKNTEEKQATIKNIWINCYSNYIQVHANFSVKNMLNKTGSIVVYVVKQHNESGNTLENNKGYRNYTFTPNHQDCEWKDYSFNIAIEAITSTVNNDSPYYKLFIKLFDENDNLLATSDYISFSIQ